MKNTNRKLKLNRSNDPHFNFLVDIKWSDNLCSVGWSCIHARGWSRKSLERVLDYCPRGHFTPTFYIGGDTRRQFTDIDREEVKDYGAPVRMMHQGAYFNFPLDLGALQLMRAIGLVDECMVMAAGGGRFPFPDDGWKTGGLYEGHS